MATANTGKKAHNHTLSVLELLTHEYWDRDLLVRIKDELEASYQYLEEHLNEGVCACGDQQTDLDFYKMVYEDIVEALRNNSMSVVPVIQEEMTNYFKEKSESHRCIRSLMNRRHSWFDEFHS